MDYKPVTQEDLAKAHDTLDETLTRMIEKRQEGKRLSAVMVRRLNKPLTTVFNSVLFAKNIDELDNAVAVLCRIWDRHVRISNHHYVEMFKIVGKFGTFKTRGYTPGDNKEYSNSLTNIDFGAKFIGGRYEKVSVPTYFSIEPHCLPREAQTKLVNNLNKGGWLTFPILLHEPEPDSTYVHYLDYRRPSGAYNDITYERRSYDFLTDANMNSALAEWEDYKEFVNNYTDDKTVPFLKKKIGGPTTNLAGCVRNFRWQRHTLSSIAFYACEWVKKNVKYDPQEEALIDLTDRLKMYQGVRPTLYLRPEDINKQVVGDFPVKCLYRPPFLPKALGG
jgi:hypothetical protein